ncbi:uncharacterized protein LAJ45_11350 [Morchella importuna]|uniref:uncharacterized protein n=1 Tax=Morchella importuna TaxID=1174673 RepID=UPI001E8EEECA|nr:uncharacterized protein LAJ45_11350 [Morchella importuna]KAH8144641.1 hypothetical protein LAJ45_11350 [Morchella importuna]
MDPSAQNNQLGKLALQIRKAIVASLPTARDQFLTISMPGRIIDTTPGGEFVPQTTYSASGDNKRKVNEAKLVDSMVPLSTVMLGPSGKSVSRSYLSALDHLVPANSGLDLEHLESDETSAATTKYKSGSKYNAAMSYLRSPAPVNTSGRTIVDVYIEKQTAYARAQSILEGVLIKNAGAAKSKAGMNADELAIATSEMKRANDKLQAAWMDWVINGHKTMIDHHFAVVDTTTIMSRIEMAKAALRRATISDIDDGTEWPRVTLSPENWAVLCANKSKSWASRNPLSPAIIQMEITRLKKIVVALKGNLEWANEHAGKNPEPAQVLNEANEPKPSQKLVDLRAALKTIQEELDAAKAEKESDEEIEGIQERLERARSAVLVQEAEEHPEADTPETEAEIAAYKEVVEAANEYKTSDPKTQDAKKTDVLEKSKAIGELLDKNIEKEKEIVAKMVAGSSGQLKRTLQGMIAERQDEIRQLELSLTSPRPAAERIKVITSIEKVKNNGKDVYVPVEGKPEVSDFVKAALAPTEEKPDEIADPWTTISFSASAMKSAESSEEASLSVQAKVEVNYGMFSGGGGTDVSSARQKLSKTMEESSVTGTFSTMLVQINRPWLHGELFEDTDIDTPTTNKLSPGPQELKDWLDNGREPELSAYGTFPWYPTAFVVAADTELEIKCSRSDAEVLASACPPTPTPMLATVPLSVQVLMLRPETRVQATEWK